MRDNSFLKLYKNDFAAAKRGDNTPIIKLPYSGFIQQRPDETFYQITNCDTTIAFAGGITVELVDCAETVKKNITSNFYYSQFTDSNGIGQIAYEFGNIGQDFWTTPLYLRITDNINGNKWYSYNFLVTYYQAEISCRFDYYDLGQINGIAYDINPGIQSIRFSNFYENDIDPAEKVGSYIQYGGDEVAYNSIITDLQEYLISSIDKFNYNRILRLFQSSFVYMDGFRVTKNKIEKDKRAGDTNWFPATLVVNPKNEPFHFTYQLYQPFTSTSVFVANNSASNLTNFNTALTSGLYIDFNRDVFVAPGFEYKLYKNGSLVFTGTANATSTNRLTLTGLSAYTFANGDYSLTIDANLLYNNGEYWTGFVLGDWNWTIANGEFDASEFDNAEFLT